MKYEFFANSIVVSNEKNQYPKDYKSKDELEALLNGKEHCHVLDVCPLLRFMSFYPQHKKSPLTKYLLQHKLSVDRFLAARLLLIFYVSLCEIHVHLE